MAGHVNKTGDFKELSHSLSHLLFAQSTNWLPTRSPKFKVTPAGLWSRYYSSRF